MCLLSARQHTISSNECTFGSAMHKWLSASGCLPIVSKQTDIMTVNSSPQYKAYCLNLTY